MKNYTHAAVLCALLFASPVFGETEVESVSLECESRNAVTLSALKGGAAGLAAFVGFQMLTNELQVPKFCEHKYSASLCTLAGATLAALWQYNHTPEKHFEFARFHLMRIAQNDLFTLLVTVEPSKLINALKDRYFREKLPLYVAFKQLDKICMIVDQTKDSLNEVMASYRTDLHQEAAELQLIADMYLVILKDIFRQLKDDPNFINECNAGTLELMKDAQEAAAHAAQSSAFTQHMAAMSSSQNTSSVSVATQIAL